MGPSLKGKDQIRMEKAGLLGTGVLRAPSRPGPQSCHRVEGGGWGTDVERGVGARSWLMWALIGQGGPERGPVPGQSCI